MTPRPRYQLLAIDIDGTLVNSRDELTTSTRAALLEASAAGVRLVLATGRRYSRTLHLVEPLQIDVPLVTASGALVKDPIGHETLYRAEFSGDLLPRALRAVDEAGFAPLLCADTFAEGFDFYLSRWDVPCAMLGEYLRLNPDDGRVWPRLIEEPPPGVFLGFAMGTRQEMLGLESVLHSRMPGELSTHVLRSPKYTGFMCEIAPAGATKWSAIARLAAQWGIDEDCICAVGDDVNDIPMIRAAGLGIAMGNAQPAVKVAADRVAPTHDDDGLVEVVRWLLKE
ncbi:MAG: HAD family hydrolase [Planctomycetota bacterium]